MAIVEPEYLVVLLKDPKGRFLGWRDGGLHCGKVALFASTIKILHLNNIYGVYNWPFYVVKLSQGKFYSAAARTGFITSKIKPNVWYEVIEPGSEMHSGAAKCT